MSTNAGDLIKLDLTGLVCPEPLIQVTNAMQTAGPGQRIEATIDFSPAVLTLTSLVQRQPWDVLIQGIGESVWRLTFTRRTGSGG